MFLASRRGSSYTPPPLPPFFCFVFYHFLFIFYHHFSFTELTAAAENLSEHKNRWICTYQWLQHHTKPGLGGTRLSARHLEKWYWRCAPPPPPTPPPVCAALSPTPLFPRSSCCSQIPPPPPPPFSPHVWRILCHYHLTTVNTWRVYRSVCTPITNPFRNCQCHPHPSRLPR